MKLSSNMALYNYLISLASILEVRNAQVLATAVRFAIAQSSTSSTEFLGESLIALKKVSACGSAFLSTEGKNDLASAIEQLEVVFKKRRRDRDCDRESPKIGRTHPPGRLARRRATDAQILSMSSFAVGDEATLSDIQAASASFANNASGTVQIFQPA